MTRRAWLSAILLVGCNFDWDSHDPRLTEGQGVAGDVPAGGSGASVATGNGGMASGSGGSRGGAGGDGSGGSAPPAVCGNAIVEDGEQCDDGNTAAGDGCDGLCVVECPTGGMIDPASHHCYVFQPDALDFAAARAACLERGPGFELAALSSQAELDVVVTWMPVTDSFAASGDIFLGAVETRVNNVFEWLNGEPFLFAPWHVDEPNDYEGPEPCLELRFKSDFYGFNDTTCTSGQASLCERTPAGTGP